MALLPKYGLAYGKFQPFHLGHLDYIKTTAKNCKKLLIGIGYPEPIENYPPDPDKPENTSPLSNPFNFFERLLMITNSLLDENINPRNFLIIPLPPFYLKPKEIHDYLPKNTVIFYGLISDWEKIKLNRAVNNGFKVESFVLKERPLINATEIRRRIINNENWEELVPKAVVKIIKEINGVERIKELNKKHNENKESFNVNM